LYAKTFAVLLAIYIWGTKTTERQVSGLNWLTGGVALGIVVFLDIYLKRVMLLELLVDG